MGKNHWMNEWELQRREQRGQNGSSQLGSRAEAKAEHHSPLQLPIVAPQLILQSLHAMPTRTTGRLVLIEQQVGALALVDALRRVVLQELANVSRQPARESGGSSVGGAAAHRGGRRARGARETGEEAVTGRGGEERDEESEEDVSEDLQKLDRGEVRDE